MALSRINSKSLEDSTVLSADIADGSIVNADINASAAIAQSKLVDIVNADIDASAAISQSKLVNVVNADIDASAAIAQSKVALDITNSEVNASAAIVTTKISGAVTSIASHGLATSATTDTTNADNVSSGTLPDGRFPATLPAASGVNLTALNASNLGSGSIADARVPASAVTQHVTATDTSSIENDILNLAINQAVLNDRVAFNLDNSFIDGFEDDTGITTETNVDRDTTGEYVSSVITTGASIDSNTLLLVQSNTTDGSTTFTDSSASARSATAGGGVQHDTAQKKFGASSIYFDGSGDYLTFPDSDDWNWTGGFTVDFWVRFDATGTNRAIIGHHSSNSWSGINWLIQYKPSAIEGNIGNNGGSGMSFTSSSVSTGQWYHFALVGTASTLMFYVDGTRTQNITGTSSFNNVSAPFRIGQHGATFTEFKGWMEEIRYSNVARWSGASFTLPTSAFGEQTVSATGTLISDAQTASSSRTSCSGVIIYEDYAGTNTIGTDLKIYFTANNGSNWTEASSYATAVTYSGSKKLVKLGATTVTAGTQVAMKAVWANQAANKEARLHGWAVNY